MLIKSTPGSYTILLQVPQSAPEVPGGDINWQGFKHILKGEGMFSVLGISFCDFCFPASLFILLFCFSLLFCFCSSLLLCFSTFLMLCFSTVLHLCFSALLLPCFPARPASLLLCSLLFCCPPFPVSVLLCLPAFLLLCFSLFFVTNF